MINLFYIVLTLAIWHFAYEGIIAPALRNSLRYKYFALRDELRNLKISGLEQGDEKIYSVLDQSICSIIHTMSFITMGNYFLLKKRLSKNPELKEELKETFDFVGNAKNKNLIDIDAKMASLSGKALVINNGGWIIYLLVPVIVILIVGVFTEKVKNLTIKAGKRLAYSASDFDHSENGDITLADIRIR